MSELILFNVALLGDILTITCWQVHGESSSQMHILTIPVFSQATCVFAMRYTREVTDDMFCTYTRIGEGTCSVSAYLPSYQSFLTKW